MVELLVFPEHFEGLERFHIFFFIRHPFFCNRFCKRLEDLHKRGEADDKKGAYDPEDHIAGEENKKEGIDGNNAKDDECLNPPVNMGHQQFFSFQLPLQHLPGKVVKIADPVRYMTDILDHLKASFCGNGRGNHKISSDFR